MISNDYDFVSLGTLNFLFDPKSAKVVRKRDVKEELKMNQSEYFYAYSLCRCDDVANHIPNVGPVRASKVVKKAGVDPEIDAGNFDRLIRALLEEVPEEYAAMVPQVVKEISDLKTKLHQFPEEVSNLSNGEGESMLMSFTNEVDLDGNLRRPKLREKILAGIQQPERPAIPQPIRTKRQQRNYDRMRKRKEVTNMKTVPTSINLDFNFKKPESPVPSIEDSSTVHKSKKRKVKAESKAPQSNEKSKKQKELFQPKKPLKATKKKVNENPQRKVSESSARKHDLLHRHNSGILSIGEVAHRINPDLKNETAFVDVMDRCKLSHFRYINEARRIMQLKMRQPEFDLNPRKINDFVRSVFHEVAMPQDCSKFFERSVVEEAVKELSSNVKSICMNSLEDVLQEHVERLLRNDVSDEVSIRTCLFKVAKELITWFIMGKKGKVKKEKDEEEFEAEEEDGEEVEAIFTPANFIKRLVHRTRNMQNKREEEKRFIDKLKSYVYGDIKSRFTPDYLMELFNSDEGWHASISEDCYYKLPLIWKFFISINKEEFIQQLFPAPKVMNY